MIPKTGTREWSEHSFNCCKGCANSCLYCYARDSRFNTKRGLDWAKEELTFPKVKKWPGVVMFPTTHDFTPGNVKHCLMYLDHLLDAGNKVLVVTKAGIDIASRIVDSIVDRLCQYPREQSEIRFTLTHRDPAVGWLWEPNAPTIRDRYEALYDAHTRVPMSVSCEPWLDTVEFLIETVKIISPGCETIWIGHANKLRQRTQWFCDQCESADDVAELREAIENIEARQTPAAARRVYDAIKNDPKVRWKDSYQRAIGLAGPEDNTK